VKSLHAVSAPLLCLFVTLVPAIEQRLVHQLDTRLHHTGLEFIHGIIAWLCLLGLYLVVSQLAKIKVHLETSAPPTVHSTR